MAADEVTTDEELVEEAQRSPSGDLRAFESLVVRHQSKVVANCRHLAGSPDDAEDLAQEVFVKAFFGLPRFEGRSKFRTWLHTLKVNHCLNFLKKARRGRATVDVDDPGIERNPQMQVHPTAEQRLAASSDRQRIDRALDAMSDTLKIPLIMRDLDGLSYQEIADILGVGLSAVKMRIKRGREEFRSLFEGEGTSPEGKEA
jgi:RNA polymerase sigma-70 factor (ECF subfamily)